MYSKKGLKESINTRAIFVQMRRIHNKISSWKNILKLSFYSINYGKDCCIHGTVGLTLHPSAKVSIGNNFYMSNGDHQNPLSGNDEGHLHVEKNAILNIGNNVGISSVRIWCTKMITIGNNVKIGGDVSIIDTDAHSINWHERRIPNIDQSHKCDAAIVIEDDVFIGMHTLILKGVTIGARTIIGAGSVITKSIPPDSIACGNPAIVVKGTNQQ